MDEEASCLPQDEKRNGVFCKLNFSLLPYKVFYFLFFSSAGSLFPYLSLYYKALRLSPQQTGVLIGIRPLLHLLSCSLWGIFVDNNRKRIKVIFLLSILAWLCSIFSISLVPRPHHIAPCQHRQISNDTGNVLEINNSTQGQHNPVTLFDSIVRSIDRNTTVVNDSQNVEMKPWRRNDSGVLDPDAFQTTKYEGVGKAFSILLAITFPGTLLASPAIPFADTGTLQALGCNDDFYGRQRQWGSLGWGISSLVVGIYVHSIKTESDCQITNAVDFLPCFYAYGVLMAAALLPAILFKFNNELQPETTRGVFAKVKTFLNLDCIVLLFTILMSGCSWGLIQAFLLWHLQDLGGSQLLFSFIAAIQCLSEVSTFNMSGYLIRNVGYHRILLCSLLYSSGRFILYSVVENPWLVLIIEVFHGMSTTLVWAVAVSFVSSTTNVAASILGILSGIHWGLGLGGGSILCGIIVNSFGAKRTFLAFGIVPIINLIILIATHNRSYFFGSKHTADGGDQEIPNASQEHDSLLPEKQSSSKNVCESFDVWK